MLNQPTRQFETGATRDADNGKPDYEGFLSPLVIKAFGQYMSRHRTQADGKLRDSDNWQKGIPFGVYMKSLWRHFHDMWTMHRGFIARDHTGATLTMEDTLSAIMFNVMGYFHEWLKRKHSDTIMQRTHSDKESLDLQVPGPAADNCRTTCAVTKEHAVEIKQMPINSVPVGRDETEMFNLLLRLGCPLPTARYLVAGTSFAAGTNSVMALARTVYISGPMRHLPEFNFPAFDRVRDAFLKRGFTVISPADIDRASGVDPKTVLHDPWVFIDRDYFALKYVAHVNGAIAMMPGWERSAGAAAELFLSRWGEIRILSAPKVQDAGDTMLLRGRGYDEAGLINALDLTLDRQ